MRIRTVAATIPIGGAASSRELEARPEDRLTGGETVGSDEVTVVARPLEPGHVLDLPRMTMAAQPDERASGSRRS
jgi:hypothetical protein